MKQIVITGGFGYLGSRLAERFADDGYDVTLLARKIPDDPHTTQWAKRFKVVLADITIKESVVTALANTPDIVLHLAAVNEHVCAKDPQLAFLVNSFGAQTMAHAAGEAGVKHFLYLSTFHVYGVSSGTITEQTPPVPLHPYGITHLVAELFCREAAQKHHMQLSILRFSNGIGAPALHSIDRWTLLLLSLCKQAHEKQSLTLQSAGTSLRDFVSLDDLYQAVTLLIATPQTDPVINVGSGNAVSVLTMAKTVQQEYEHLYHKQLPLHVPHEQPHVVLPLYFSIDKLKSLGFMPTTHIAEEVRKTLKFCERFKK